MSIKERWNIFLDRYFFKIAGTVFALACMLSFGFVGYRTVDEFRSRNRPPTLWWNEYFAVLDDKKVEISESQHGGEKTPTRIVHITAATNHFVGITGHDYDMDGTWDAIFWGGYPQETNGWNSYIRTAKGWRWSPCPGDEKMTPIPQDEIAKALAALDASLTNRTLGNLATVWTYKSTTDLRRF